MKAVEEKTLPPWFRQDLPDMDKIREMKFRFRLSRLHTVCESALCPNLGQCWGAGVATFMILGEVCTRACRFCAVSTGRPQVLDVEEPVEVAKAVKQLNLRYVVITSVARDDLPDEGADHFFETLQAIRRMSPKIKIEVLIPDFSNKEESIKRLIEADPDVIGHNIETVRRLSTRIRSKAMYDRSLSVLNNFKKFSPKHITKSSFMLGLGEEHNEIECLMKDLVDVGVEILTIGQYLKPTHLKRHIPVEKFYTPSEFEFYRELGLKLGFKYVESGPKVRSSFIAETAYAKVIHILSE